MKKLIAIGALILTAVAISACGSSGNKAQHAVAKQDIQTINSQVQELRRAEPLPRFHDSAALRVQDAYYTADSDPNKIWYVTLVALDGTPYAHFTTKGAPQPAGDQVTNPVQQTCASSDSNGPSSCDVIGLPEPNGVHQGSNTGYVGILTTGAMVRIPENAVISDQPFSVNSPVRLSINESAAISKTDTRHSTGGYIPTGSSQRAK